MNIGIDANCLIFERAGIGKYTKNIIENLIKIDRKNHYFLYFTFLRHKSDREAVIQEFLQQLRNRKNVTYKIIPLPARWYEFFSFVGVNITNFIKDEIDVFFAPYASGIFKKGFLKNVFMCHDLVFMRFPEHRGSKLSNYYLKRHKIALKNCQKVIVPSRATKKDLKDFLSVDDKKIVVIPEAVDARFKIQKSSSHALNVVSRYLDPKLKYILSVGTLEPRKNLVKLVEAYQLLPHALQSQYSLVLTGGKGWRNEQLIKTIANLNLTDKVIFTGFVSDEDLPYIYKRASVFVYPSLYEGFGLPPLEALASGTPTIVADNSSLPEVVGKAALLVDAKNEEMIARTIKQVLLRQKMRANLAKTGFKQAQKFSWEKAAQETLKVFDQVYDS